MNVLFLEADTPEEFNTSWWRCRQPCAAINSQPGCSAKTIPIFNIYENNELLDWCDILIIERLLIQNVFSLIEEAKQEGKLVIASLDDAYHLMEKNHPTYKYWIEGEIVDNMNYRRKLNYAPVQQLEWGLKLVDGVITPSKLLCDDYKKFNPRTYVTKRGLGRDGYRRHGLKGDPGLVDRFREVCRFLRVGAPVSGKLAVRPFDLLGLGRCRVVVRMERLDVEIRVHPLCFASLDHGHVLDHQTGNRPWFYATPRSAVYES